MKISSVEHGVERVASGEQLGTLAPRARPRRAQHRRGRQDREAGHDRARRAARRWCAPSSVRRDDAAERRDVDEGDSTSTSPQRRSGRPSGPAPAHRSRPAAARPRRPRHRVGAGLLAQVEDHRQRVDPDREARDHVAATGVADVGDAQDLGRAPRANGSSARARARSRASSSIAAVGLPVNVFSGSGGSSRAGGGTRPRARSAAAARAAARRPARACTARPPTRRRQGRRSRAAWRSGRARARASASSARAPRAAAGSPGARSGRWR